MDRIYRINGIGLKAYECRKAGTRVSSCKSCKSCLLLQDSIQRSQHSLDVLGSRRVAHQPDAPDLSGERSEAGADLDERERILREKERQLCTAPPVKVEPNEWADAVAASAEHHLRELSLENKQLKRHQRRTAKRGRRIAAVLLWRKMHVLDARTGAQKAFAAWYVFSQNTQPSSKQKRVRAARLCLESRAGSVLDGVHAHYSASKLVKGGLRRELSLERFWALARDFHLAPAFASYAYLMHLARDVLRGDSALSREQFGRALAQLALEAAGKAGEPPSVAVARVLDCMETSNGLAKVGLSRAVKFRHG